MGILDTFKHHQSEKAAMKADHKAQGPSLGETGAAGTVGQATRGDVQVDPSKRSDTNIGHDNASKNDSTFDNDNSGHSTSNRVAEAAEPNSFDSTSQVHSGGHHSHTGPTDVNNTAGHGGSQYGERDQVVQNALAREEGIQHSSHGHGLATGSTSANAALAAHDGGAHKHHKGCEHQIQGGRHEHYDGCETDGSHDNYANGDFSRGAHAAAATTSNVPHKHHANCEHQTSDKHEHYDDCGHDGYDSKSHKHSKDCHHNSGGRHTEHYEGCETDGSHGNHVHSRDCEHNQGGRHEHYDNCGHEGYGGQSQGGEFGTSSSTSHHHGSVAQDIKSDLGLGHTHPTSAEGHSHNVHPNIPLVGESEAVHLGRPAGAVDSRLME